MNKKIIIAIISLLIIGGLIIFIYKNISIEKNKEDEYQDYTPQQEISDEQNRQTKVTLYFENSETGELESEIRLIDANTLIKEPEKEIINLLIKGPQSSNLKKLIPDGTVVYDVKVKNSCAEINVSNQFLEFGDEKNKLKIINSIVNTLTNLKEINSIKFLINGETNEKFADTYIKNNN
ncbi:MAG: hypothetical protein BHW02_03885 [Clostridium sp. 28_12]|nr:MAG: hypothetical protein BHW02_03885 [Clostridium sp. 28_12]